ncbi:MAG: hypothetical protein U0736_08655 [Gemmataceae bacterium]
MFLRMCCLAALFGPGALPTLAADAPRELIPVRTLRLDAVELRDADVDRTPAGDALRVRFGFKQQWPGITVKPRDGAWDLSAFSEVAVEVKNVSKGAIQIGCRLDSPATEDKADAAQAHAQLGAGQTATLRVMLRRALPPPLAGKLFGMRGFPGGYTEKGGIDPARVTRFLIFTSKPRGPATVEVRSVRVGGVAQSVPADPSKLFPLIDRFGQYVHADWPGKLHTGEELAQRRDRESAELKKDPQPAGWNQYGGWEDGPHEKATGFFRAEKREGKWWLIDPAGRLFWSHGVDCVRPGAETPITDRRHWYAELPERETPLARFYGKGHWAPHNYYEGKSYDTYDFLGANLARKYGGEWRQAFADRTHERFRAWGVNTVGNWSDPAVYQLRRTPYVATVNSDGPKLEGSSGYWGKFPDVFDPRFAAGLRKRMAAQKGRSVGDPWCIGTFVDNELGWGDDLSLATAALASPSDQPAKVAFVADLKASYHTIDALNRTWGTTHADWNALLASRTVPDTKKARGDLAAFATRTAETYFRVCRDAVKEAAPDQLYLGCRFAWVNDRAVRAAAKFCDVLSFNLYRDTIGDFRLPDGVDKPILVGEFHFGALDRGMFHSGLRPLPTQAARAAAYRRYVEGAITHPNFVGTHWFQLYDQATTGRGDGENYQIGWLDGTDTPYPETVAAVRAVGRGMYALRAGKQ